MYLGYPDLQTLLLAAGPMVLLVICAVGLAYFYLEARTEKPTDAENEIVKTTNTALAIVRRQMAQIEVEIRAAQKRQQELQQDADKHYEEIRQLQAKIWTLEAEKSRLSRLYGPQDYFSQRP